GYARLPLPPKSPPAMSRCFTSGVAAQTPSGSRLHPEDYYGQMAINGLGQASKYIEAMQADLADAAKEDGR
ncbi:hypothetical protein, partial [Salipiger sp. PrR003]|uniref:hypothetical protein n=1 Tax=Salipiger sp. PrR003 TaxID=2706776 RepID=UPI001941F77A